MKTLDEIAIECGTDKASTHPVKGHGYAPHYDRLFTPLRLDPVRLLEIGVATGASVKTWLEYFRNAAQVFGIDNAPALNQWLTPGKHGNYTFVQGDAGDRDFLERFKGENGTDFDIIIDDATHRIDHILISFKSLWPAIRPGGYYCIEDLCVAYGDNSYAEYSHYAPAGSPNHREVLHQLVDDLNGYGKYDSLYFSRGLAIIRKVSACE